MQTTYMPKNSDTERKIYVVDAKGKILGRLATKVASVLRGKHKPTFTPHVDTGDSVIVINAAHIQVTGKKAQDKEYQRYSGYPSGQKTVNFETMMKKNPAKVIELAVKGMLPKNRLGNKIYKNLKVYTGEEHPHASQKPVKLEV